jgi:hypothetical protein
MYFCKTEIVFREYQDVTENNGSRAIKCFLFVMTLDSVSAKVFMTIGIELYTTTGSGFMTFIARELLFKKKLLYSVKATYH